MEDEGVALLVIKNQKVYNEGYVARLAHLQSEWNKDPEAPPLKVNVKYATDTPAMAAYAANGKVIPYQRLAARRVSLHHLHSRSLIFL